MKIIDTRGMTCPAPLIATKRALNETDDKEGIRIIIDSRTTFDNVSRFLKDNGALFSSEESNNTWTISISSDKGLSATELNSYCDAAIPHFKKGDFIIAFTSDTMGEGDEKLGHLLVENFIKAVKDLNTLPQKIVFYNKGVLLGSEDSTTIGHLKELEKMGVEMLFCATCVNYYSLGEKIRIGILSNMFEIAGVMESAGKIIKP
jgi:selenium metabolism protein YedF